MRKISKKVRNFFVCGIVSDRVISDEKITITIYFIFWGQGQEVKEKLWLALSFFPSSFQPPDL